MNAKTIIDGITIYLSGLLARLLADEMTYNEVVSKRTFKLCYEYDLTLPQIKKRIKARTIK